MKFDILQKRNIFTVSEITKKIKRILQDNFFDIWVRGEVSNYKIAASGHIYFSLKDESAVIRAVLFRGYQNGIKFEIDDGLKVIVHGNLDLFDRRGEYQVIVDFIEPEGRGALQLAFEQLKEKLSKEGLFDESHKQPIPPFPDSVGIITSPSGAALRDILNVTQRRFRGIRLVIYPTLVQGEGAAREIAEAIKRANERNEVDVLIVGRGGGSIEDLWPFNEEIVARAIYDSRIPVISAVGHEIDFTISDFVADIRAPTPSAAAELVVRNKEELIKWFGSLYARLFSSVDRIIDLKREKASRYSFDLLYRLVTGIVHQKGMTLDDLVKSLSGGTESIMMRAKSKFENIAGTLNALSPLNTLARGYATVSRLPDEIPVFSVEQLAGGDMVKTRLKDGFFTGRVEDVRKE